MFCGTQHTVSCTTMVRVVSTSAACRALDLPGERDDTNSVQGVGFRCTSDEGLRVWAYRLPRPGMEKFAVSAFLGGGGSKPETLNPVTATGTEDQSENLGSESLTWRFMGSYKQGYKSLIWVISIVTPKP